MYICLSYGTCFSNMVTLKLQMQNMHKTIHDRHLTGVHWPITRGRVWGSRGGRGGRASTGGAR